MERVLRVELTHSELARGTPGPSASVTFRLRPVSGALSGRRGEIGNHKVAGKIGVMTLAALPRNQATQKRKQFQWFAGVSFLR